MDANYEGTNSTGAGPWHRAGNMVVMAVLLARSYQAGVGRGGEKTTGSVRCIKIPAR
jgi:hypothetical protein